jgi:hypothetical protein
MHLLCKPGHNQWVVAGTEDTHISRAKSIPVPPNTFCRKISFLPENFRLEEIESIEAIAAIDSFASFASKTEISGKMSMQAEKETWRFPRCFEVNTIKGSMWNR